MRLHTDILTPADVHRATANLPGVSATVTEHGSRSHARALEVRLTGNGHARNYISAPDSPAATWDEWGAVMAYLYAADPAAVWGSVKRPTYASAEHFHAVTRYRFDDDGTLPDDTHKRHAWDWSGVGRVHSCTRCSAQYEPQSA